MRVLDAASLAALESGNIVTRSFMLFDLQSGLIGFWDDLGNITIDSQVYIGSGGAFTITPVQSVSDLTAQTVGITLSGLDAQVLQSFESDGYHQRPVTISYALFNADTGGLIQLSRWFSGIIDQATRKERANGEATLEINCESKSRGLFRAGTRTRSDADQKQLGGPLDGLFKHVAASADTDINWGRAGPQSPGG